MRTKFGGLVAGLAFLIGLGASPAHAVPTLSWSYDGGAATTCADGDDCDASAIAGVVTLVEPFGGFTGAITGFANPALGLPTLLSLSPTVVQTTAGAHTLDISFSETGFTSLGPISGEFGGTLSSIVGEQVNIAAYFDTGNAPFAQTTLIGSANISDLGLFSGAFDGSGPAVTPYSLTQRVVLVTVDGSQAQLGMDFDLAVPEPGTLALLGLGLAGLAATRRRKQ